jgi:hypothetical protein
LKSSTFLTITQRKGKEMSQPLKFTITDEDVLREKMVKPGWGPVLITDVRVELTAKKDSNNLIVEGEYADKNSEFYRVPFIAWLNEKVKNAQGGMVSFARALGYPLNAKLNEVDYAPAKGKYLYAKWAQVIQNKEGQPGTPRNAIVDWAPLPPKFADLAKAEAVPASEEVQGF